MDPSSDIPQSWLKFGYPPRSSSRDTHKSFQKHHHMLQQRTIRRNFIPKKNDSVRIKRHSAYTTCPNSKGFVSKHRKSSPEDSSSRMDDASHTKIWIKEQSTTRKGEFPHRHVEAW